MNLGPHGQQGAKLKKMVWAGPERQRVAEMVVLKVMTRKEVGDRKKGRSCIRSSQTLVKQDTDLGSGHTAYLHFLQQSTVSVFSLLYDFPNNTFF